MAFTNPATRKLPATLPSEPAQTLTPPPAYTTDPTLSVSTADFEDTSSSSDEEFSAIHISISSPLTITGDNNLISLDPSLSASRIALGVVDALKQINIGGSGVPMIDEEGRPRPIKVDVMAETRVEGSRNVVGERGVLSTVLGGLKRKTGVEERERNECFKRERAGSEPVEVGGKRVKRE